MCTVFLLVIKRKILYGVWKQSSIMDKIPVIDIKIYSMLVAGRLPSVFQNKNNNNF